MPDEKDNSQPFLLWGIIGLLIFLNINLILVASSLTAILATSAICWSVGIFLYKKRMFAKKIMEQEDKTFVQMLQEYSDTKQTVITNSRLQAADNDNVVPLTSVEEAEWLATIEAITNTDYDNPFDIQKKRRNNKHSEE